MALEPTVDDHIRDVLVAVTGWIPSEQLSGLVFGASLVASEHAMNLIRWLKP